MKKLLIVSPYFPPTNTPDMQRVRMGLSCYAAHGWDATVLTVEERYQGGLSEPELMRTLPATARIVRVPAWPLRWARLLGFGNIGLRAWPFLYREGARLLRREKFDLVFFSTTQFAVFTLGPLWKARFGVPYVLDFQDPWRTNAYERSGARPPPGGWKYQFARLQARLFEGWTVRGASALMSVSPLYLEDFRQRYPSILGKPSAVLPFGASQSDLVHASELPAPPQAIVRRVGERHLVYTGAAGPISPRALAILFEALRQYREQSPERSGRIRLHFIGTSYGEGGRAKCSILPVAESFGVSDQVTEIPYRVGFLDAIRLQQDADGLVLLGAPDPAYVPSKAFVYYLTRKPILALLYPDTVLERLLDELACAHLVRIQPNAGDAGSFPALWAFFDALVDGTAGDLMPVRRDDIFRSRYLAEELAGQQCALFEAGVSYHQT